jgi:hypothetical protein
VDIEVRESLALIGFAGIMALASRASASDVVRAGGRRHSRTTLGTQISSRHRR